MATDDNDRAWKRLAVSVAEALPGEWTVGRMGTNGVLVRVPVDWTFTWIRPERSRKIDDPRIIVGRVNLVSPFRLGYHYGARSDVFGGPGKVDLTADNAEQTVLDFITGYGLPQVDLWDAIRMAEAAKRNTFDPRPSGDVPSSSPRRPAGDSCSTPDPPKAPPNKVSPGSAETTRPTRPTGTPHYSKPGDRTAARAGWTTEPPNANKRSADSNCPGAPMR